MAFFGHFGPLLRLFSLKSVLWGWWTSPRLPRAWVARDIVWNALYGHLSHMGTRAFGRAKTHFLSNLPLFLAKGGNFRPKIGLFRQLGPCKRTAGCTWWAQLAPYIGEHGSGGLVYHLWHTKVAKDPRTAWGRFLTKVK